MREKLTNLSELKQKGLYIIDENDVVVENNIMKTLKEKKLLISDLAKLTGLSRQNINAVVNNKMKPGIDFALKVAYILGMPVEEIFVLTEHAWIKPYKKEKDSTLYINVIELEIVDNTEKKKAISSNGFEYFDTDKKEYLTKEQIYSLQKSHVEDNVKAKIAELEKDEDFTELNKSKIKSIAIDELKNEFGTRYIKVYKKLGEKIEPYIIN